jgi:hypothetical protein
MITDNFCCYLQNRLIQTSVSGGQRYSETCLFSIPWLVPWSRHAATFSITTLSTSMTRLGQILAIWATFYSTIFYLNKQFPRMVCIRYFEVYNVFDVHLVNLQIKFLATLKNRRNFNQLSGRTAQHNGII